MSDKKNISLDFSWDPELYDITPYAVIYRQKIIQRIVSYLLNLPLSNKNDFLSIVKTNASTLSLFPYLSWLNYKVFLPEANHEFVDKSLFHFISDYKKSKHFDCQSDSLYKKYAIKQFEEELNQNAKISCSLEMIRNKSFNFKIFSSLNFLQFISPKFYREYECLIDEIVLLKGTGLISSSHPYIIGSIFLCPKKTWSYSRFAELIIHECSHQILDLITSLDSLILNSEMFAKSPLRVDPRPLIGILHATFVLKRICKFYQLLQEKRRLTSTEGIIYSKYIDDLQEGIFTLNLYAKWTKHGEVFFDKLKTSH